MYDAKPPERPIEKFSDTASRLLRAANIKSFVGKVGKGNKMTAAVGGFGQVDPAEFDFEKAYGPRTDENGNVVKEGLTPEKVASIGAIFARQAEEVGNMACAVCEYAASCELRGRLYEKFCSPSKSGDRNKLRARMNAVEASGGTKTMSCPNAIASKRPTKKDWDY